ncbi:MAG: CRISPR system precrRNA processing endoribonuclease RAMP protein Cas6 [Magnetococcales bacterium]|nr:CRISPR system precrRNA processing endoribonuclease RAMP protein Cas6 [Magnetococcales bacterium]
MEVTLWGWRATAAREVVAESIQVMGDNGLNYDRQPVRFRVLNRQDKPSVTFRQETDRFAGYSWQKALLVFETPLLVQSRTTDDKGNSQRRETMAESFHLTSLIGNAAYDLMAWYLEECQPNEAADAPSRHILCRALRQSAEQVLEASIDDWHSHLVPVDLGQRISRSNGRRFPVKGLLGHVEVTGRINELLPWLIVLECLGGGQKRSMGFGTTRLWLR